MGYGGMPHVEKITVAAVAGYLAVAIESGMPLDWKNLKDSEKKKYEDYVRQIVEADEEKPVPTAREAWQTTFTQVVQVIWGVIQDAS